MVFFCPMRYILLIYLTHFWDTLQLFLNVTETEVLDACHKGPINSTVTEICCLITRFETIARSLNPIQAGVFWNHIGWGVFCAKVLSFEVD